jgi:hypothetical protein
MSTHLPLPIEQILDCDKVATGAALGLSRNGHEIYGFALGSGRLHVSLIAGCHADEPVGPATLSRLVSFLGALDDRHPLLSTIRWRIVPHANPDGRLRNDLWVRNTRPIEDSRGAPDIGYVLDTYLEHVVRELPGDDIEFGFPRSAEDTEARPENRAVAEFLADGAPYQLHGSLHGMGFSPGPWFLIESSWIERCQEMRDRLRHRVWETGYDLFDPDRGGEKGFTRIDTGFCTRPDSRAMRAHFETVGDQLTAAKFRPSSMEYVRGLGGDPLTFVSEMPLFLTPSEIDGHQIALPALRLIRHQLDAHLGSDHGCDEEARTIGVRPMPVRDQQRLQLSLLDEALQAVAREL